MVAGTDVWLSNMEGYLDSGRAKEVSLLFWQKAKRDTAFREVDVSVLGTRLSEDEVLTHLVLLSAAWR